MAIVFKLLVITKLNHLRTKLNQILICHQITIEPTESVLINHQLTCFLLLTEY